MDLIPIVTGLLDLAQKGDEYKDEYLNLSVTVSTLKDVFEKADSHGLPNDDPLLKLVNDRIQETVELLETAPKQLNIFNKVVSLFHSNFDRGQKLKDKNEELNKLINLLNLKMNTAKNVSGSKRTLPRSESEDGQLKRVLTKESMESVDGEINRSKTFDPDMLKATLVDDDQKHQKTQVDGDGPTQIDNPNANDADNIAFEVELFLSGLMLEELKKLRLDTQFPPNIVKWDGKDVIEYSIGREMLQPLNKLSGFPRLSRDHCQIVARRTPLKGNGNENGNGSGNGTEDNKESTRESIHLTDSPLPKFFTAPQDEDEMKRYDAKYTYEYQIKDTSSNGTYFFTIDDRGKHKLSRLHKNKLESLHNCLLYTSPSPRDRQKSRMPSSA
eukprot:TRINITY_DN6882_c0_g1_i1.p1 TRINITY_DN6882_c0_g1~~TRINITY_DN6882_c0_g1_i1.p1  ORF type:complete len:385 (+),score=86.00 TRINITY_DN6882_c0_g1_i1:74-1228(+)